MRRSFLCVLVSLLLVAPTWAQSRLPTVGSDVGTWGTILNDYLTQGILSNTGSSGSLPTGQGQLFSNTNCSANITTPVSKRTSCIDQTTGTLYTYDGTGWQSDAALATKVINTADPRWGCKFDQVTDDAACINAAIAAAPTIVGPGDMGTQGGAIVLVPKQALIKSTISIPGQNNSVTITLQCEGMYTSGFIWGGGNSADMVTINRADNANTLSHVVRGCGFYNGSTSGSGLTAVRATNINGIRFGSRTVGTSGQNAIVIEENGFFYLDNGIISNNVNGPVSITIRKNFFSLLYNQTAPVVNPVTDTPVTGHGNAVFFGASTVPQSLVLIDNDSNVQNWIFDSQGANGVPNFVAIGNKQVSTSFSGAYGGIRTASSGPFYFAGNAFATNGNSLCFDLGTTALGGGSLSGGVLDGNECSGLNTGGIGVRLTFADSVEIRGNNFNNLATAIRFVGANVTNPLIGVNNYQTVTSKLSDGGATNRTILDQQIGIEFPAAVTLKTALTVPNGGTGATTLTSHGFLLGNAAGVVGATAECATGSVPYGQTGANPICSTLILPNSATSTRLVYATGANTYGESANLTFSGNTLTVTSGADPGDALYIKAAHSGTRRPEIILQNATAGTTFSGRFVFYDGNGNLGWSVGNNQTVGSGDLEFNEGTTNRAYFAVGGVLNLTLPPNVTTGGSTTISTGVGSVKMSSVNAATNAAWIPISYAGTVYYVPGWTTNSP